LRNAIQAKDRVLACRSHELRTPLNVIIGFAGTLLLKRPGALTPDQERQLRIIQSSAKHLLSLINDLLDLAKIDSGVMELDPEPIRLADLQHEVVEALRVLAGSKGLALEAGPVDPGLTLRADRRLLRQILLNLASNAIKYTESGSVRLEARRQDSDGERPLIALSVVDTGIGITPEGQAQLFQPFRRLGEPPSSRPEGTGLGLHLSQRMAALLGGRIAVASEYGKGSRFTLELPAEPQ
jgi:signal transduction histidine kinase